MTRVSWALSRMAEWLSIWGLELCHKKCGCECSLHGLSRVRKHITWVWPPSQDSNDHQVYYIFRIGVFNKKPFVLTTHCILGGGVDPQLRMAICTKPWPTAPPWPKPRAWSRVPKRGVGVCRAGGHLDLLLSHEGLGYLGWKNKNREINDEIDDFTIFTPSHEVQIPHFNSYFSMVFWWPTWPGCLKRLNVEFVFAFWGCMLACVLRTACVACDGSFVFRLSDNLRMWSLYVWTLPPANCDIPRATSEILDLEQLIFDTTTALDAASSQWAELASRLQRVSRDLLQHARELPESKISTKALPRRLRRHEVFHLAQGRLPEMEKDELGGMPRAARIWMWNCGNWMEMGRFIISPHSASQGYSLCTIKIHPRLLWSFLQRFSKHWQTPWRLVDVMLVCRHWWWFRDSLFFSRKNPSSMSLHGQSLRQLLVSVLLQNKK